MRFFFYLLIFLIFACKGSEPRQLESNQHDSLVSFNGKISTVSTGVYSYSIYLPANYSKDKKYPLLLLFDAQARGKMPLNLYDTLVEKNDWVVACSNNAKNQLQPSEYEQIYKATMDDLLGKYSIDTSMLMLGGFSGGARVAYQFAQTDSRIKGVVMNSAGFDPLNKPRPGLALVGLAGIEDFNLSEMFKGFREVFKDENVESPTLYLAFEGKHEWAPEARMKLALDYLKQACTPESKKEAAADARSEFERVKERLTRVIAFEEFSRKKYSAEFGSKDVSYFKTEVTKLNQMNAQDLKNGRIEMAYSYRRLQQFLSMLAYSYSNSALNNGQTELAEKFTNIYRIVDSSNAEWAYMKAMLAARKNDRPTATSMLKKAAELGFDNKNKRAQKQPEFSPFMTDQAFADAVLALKAKEE